MNAETAATIGYLRTALGYPGWTNGPTFRALIKGLEKGTHIRLLDAAETITAFLAEYGGEE